MKKIFSLFLLVNIFYGSSAQEIRVKVSAPEKIADKIAGVVSPLMQAEFLGFKNTPTVDLNWQPFLSSVVSENASEDDIELAKLKEIQNKLKQSGIKPEPTNQDERAVCKVNPKLGTNFIGISNGGNNSPLDNTIAISNGGIIVACVNPKIEYTNTSGTVLYNQTLKTFINDNTLPSMCDPKVIYDSGSDRFIFFAQTCDAGATASKIIIAFSKTNDPTAGWYFYSLTGNPLNDGSWFDYPKLAVSNTELFVTGNLFKTSGGTFNKAVIYEIRKTDGYSGANLTWQYWSNITGSPFTILPVGNGQQGNYGPGFYFVSTAGNTSGNTNINLYELSDDMTNTSATLTRYAVTTPTYKVAGDAQQLGSSLTLNTGDCRSLDGFYLNGIIHFVFHSDIGSGWLGINYNRLTVSSATNVSTTHGLSGTYDYSYPAVASISSTPTDKSVIIAFNRSGPSIYPETRMIACDDAAVWSSEVQVRKGDSYVDYSWTSGTSERWGDYTGICRRQNANPPDIWMAGMYGTSTKIWGQWIAEIKDSNSVVTTGVPYTTALPTKAGVYPNPVVDLYSVEFELSNDEIVIINVTDLQGRIVKELYNGDAQKGRNVFNFNKANLSAGMYFVNIKTSSKNIINEKIILSE